MMELYSGVVSYVHDGSASSQDSFSVVVSDSTNRQYQQAGKQTPTSEPTIINVEVSKVEDGTPLLRVNRGLHFLQQEDGAKVGCNKGFLLYQDKGFRYETCHSKDLCVSARKSMLRSGCE